MKGRRGKHNDEIIALYNSGEGIMDITTALHLQWSYDSQHRQPPDQTRAVRR